VLRDRDSSALVQALRGALPYLRLFQGSTFVIKVGGEAILPGRELDRWVAQLALLSRLGIGTVLVHGGGPQISDLQRRLGIDPVIVAGRRVTDLATLQATAMALNGSVQGALLGSFRAAGARAIGMSGLDAGLVIATRRPAQVIDNVEVDFGEVGDIASIDATLVKKLLEDGVIPVISPLSATAEGTPLNINADTVAAHLAVSLGAEKLIFVTAAPGILGDPDDPHSVVSVIDPDGLEQLERTGVLRGGMLPKVAALRHALAGGVASAHVVPQRIEDSILTEVFTGGGIGTMIVQRDQFLATAAAEGVEA
jgi:acetylglutamate kinase